MKTSVDETEHVYEAALRALRSGESVAVATVTRVQGSGPRAAGAKMVVHRDGRTVGTVGGGGGEARVTEEALAALREGLPRAWEVALSEHEATGLGCEGGMRVFIEVLPGRRKIVVIGAGHVGQAVAELGTTLGYAIMVVDDRSALVSPDRFPEGCELVAGAPEAVLHSLAFGPETCVVIATPHQARDELVLAVLGEKSAGYVGLMGGWRRTEATFGRARALGVTEAFLQRVHSPIGLEIGAETPREIAVSILAQIIAVAHGLPGGCGFLPAG